MSNLAGAVIQSMSVWERKEADFYPTPPDVTQGLLDILSLPRGTRIWESGCGEGDMSEVLKAAGHTVYSTDLRDTGYGTPFVDFLAATEPPGPVDWVFGNPPFEHAEAFIRSALRFTPRVAMLLKSNYWHTQRGLPLYDHAPPNMEYKLTWRPAFLKEERGNSPLMDCSWCVWRGLSGTPGWRPLRRPKVFPDVSKKPLTVHMARLRDAMQKNAAVRYALGA